MDYHNETCKKSWRVTTIPDYKFWPFRILLGKYIIDKETRMKNALLAIVFILFMAAPSYSQKVFSVKNESQADVKVFVVTYESQADLKVFKVKYENQAGENNGKWFFTKYPNQAQKRIFFVKYESQANMNIYFVKYESQAGWRNNSVLHFFY
jgi:hypothetical protein